MKDKILMLIVGILLGAAITAGCFLLFSGNNKGKMQERPEMGNFVPGERPQGGMNQNGIDSNLQNEV